jgi:hypothetical protein
MIDYPYNFSDPASNWTTNLNTNRNVLLEDYTGHYCTGCPDAASEAKLIEDANNGRVIVATLHSPNGFFQRTGTDTTFLIDYTTTAGTNYSFPSALDIVGNPWGTINRKKLDPVNPEDFNLSHDFWVNWVNNELSTSLLKANIQVQYNYYHETNGLFVHTETEFNSALTGNYHIIIYLIRDVVISPQETMNGIDYHYHHHAVLSDNINGTWGTFIKADPNDGNIFYNDYSYQLTDPSIDSTYDINNLSLITYVCNRDTYEVIQVIKTELSP